MREPERDSGRLKDMVQAARNIAAFTEGFSLEELAFDKLRYFAVVRLKLFSASFIETLARIIVFQ